MHLNIGQPDIETPEVALNAIKNFDKKVLAYSQTDGSETYRNKLAAYYAKHNITITAENIIVTTGAQKPYPL